MKKIMFFIYVCSLSITNIIAQKNIGNTITEKIDKLYLPMSDINEPGGTILIAINDSIVYSRSFGKANLELNVNTKLDNIFRLGSNTKPFTVSAILKLNDEGRLSLQDDITKYIDNYPTNGKTITIENLLTHTSGIKDFNSINGFRKNERTDFSPLEFIELFKNQPLDFEPGTKWSYSNSGYFLLGYIIEKVSGKSYGTYLETEFFEPLGMKNTMYDNTRKIIKNRADGYVPSGNYYLNGKFITTSYPYSAGSLLSTVEDLHIWYKNLFEYKIISENNLKKAFEPYVLKNGTISKTGYGWFLGNLVGSPIIEHGGGITGFYSSIAYLPKEKVFISALTNCNWNSFDFENSTKKALAIVIGKDYSENSHLTVNQLKEYEGVYQYEDLKISILEEGGNLYFIGRNQSRLLLHNFENDKFYNELEFSTYKFERDKKGKVKRIISTRSGEPNILNITNNKLPQKSIYNSIRTLTIKNVDDGIRKYKSLKKHNEKGYSFDNPNELNKLGYDLLNEINIKGAIKVFKLLVTEFPNNANGYDSLAKAYFNNGQQNLSLENYKFSLKLNSKNDNAKMMINKLKSEKD